MNITAKQIIELALKYVGYKNETTFLLLFLYFI